MLASAGTVDLQSLAGNAFPGTVIGALFLATVFACDIACSSQADPFTDQDAVRSALELLGAVSSACVAPGQQKMVQAHLGHLCHLAFAPSL